MVMTATAASETWFGEKELEEGCAMLLRLGPLSVWLTRLADEWRVASTNNDDLCDTSCSLETVEVDSEPSKAQRLRFPTQSAGTRILIQPRLADRPVVARPEHPLLIPPGDGADVFVSSPLWVGLELPSPSRLLVEIPTTRPSDTWIGNDTRNGQVAYASRTVARLTPENLPFWPHRAVTRISIHNRNSTVLAVERLSIPAPNLALYIDTKGVFWTPAVTAIQENEATDEKPQIGRTLELEGVEIRRIAEPRSLGSSNVLQRALRSLRG